MALLLTMIGRIVDGLPLAASMPSDEQVSSLTSFSLFSKVLDSQGYLPN